LLRPAVARYLNGVRVRATVTNGRLVVDQPTELPKGTVLDFVVDDEGDELDEDERAALNLAISTSITQAEAGQSAPAEEILRKLRTRRRA
jgi:hypothetical protein